MTAQRICRCGVGVALLAVSAAITVPVGPVPFTLQTLALALLPAALGGRDAVVCMAVYLAAGAVGLPVFSGFTGGVGQLAGPTGGFLWGFLVGTAAGAAVRRLPVPGEAVREALGALAMLCVSYALGTAQLMAFMGIGPEAALMTAVVPFVVPDLVKLAVGVGAGRAVRRALGARVTVS